MVSGELPRHYLRSVRSRHHLPAVRVLRLARLPRRTPAVVPVSGDSILLLAIAAVGTVCGVLIVLAIANETKGNRRR